jgi:hypothetical protein
MVALQEVVALSDETNVEDTVENNDPPSVRSDVDELVESFVGDIVGLPVDRLSVCAMVDRLVGDSDG